MMIEANTVDEWREWLKNNHDKETMVELIKYKKHTGRASLTSKEAMLEAICFGWIDTVIKRVDDDRYIQRFVKRKKTARWSENTLSYAKELIKKGKMTPAGMKAYEFGLKKFKRS